MGMADEEAQSLFLGIQVESAIPPSGAGQASIPAPGRHTVKLEGHLRLTEHVYEGRFVGCSVSTDSGCLPKLVLTDHTARPVNASSATGS